MWTSIIAEHACRGCEKLFGLMIAPLVRNKNRKDALQEAQTLVDIKDIKAGMKVFRDGKLYDTLPIPNINPLDLPLYIGNIQNRVNLNMNLSVAFDILKNTPDADISEKSVNEDWYTRWRREAEMISTKEIQALWGRILAEEVKSPGNISYRTLDVLKNLSIEEAEKFRDILTFRIGTIIINPSSNLLNTSIKAALSFKDVCMLEEAGLISSESEVCGRSTCYENNMHIFDGHKFYICIQTTLPQATDLLHGYQLTNSAYELIDIPDVDTVTYDTLKYFANCISTFHPRAVKKICAYPMNNINEIDFMHPSIEYIAD